MSKQPKVFWKASHKCFYATIQGKQTRLDPDEDRAHEVFYQLMAEKGLGDDPLVTKVLADYLAYHRKNSAPRTVEFYKEAIDSFTNWPDGKRLTVSAIRPAHVNKWIDDRHAFKLRQTKGKKWIPSDEPTSDNYRHNLIRAIKSAMAWYAAEYELDRVPLKSLKKPAQTAREVTLTDKQFRLVLEHTPAGQFRDVLIALRQTGCRLKELRTVTASHVRGRTWFFPANEAKSRKKTGRPRIIQLSDKAYEITQRLAKQNRTGPLFLNSDGKPWTHNALDRRCRRISRNMSIPFTLYGIRHLFATSAIKQGVDLISLADALGHSDLKMLSKVYSHVHLDDAHRAETLKKALGGVA